MLVGARHVQNLLALEPGIKGYATRMPLNPKPKPVPSRSSIREQSAEKMADVGCGVDVEDGGGDFDASGGHERALQRNLRRHKGRETNQLDV